MPLERSPVALTVRGTQPKSVFRLNGADENSASFALGWVLEQSAHFRRAVAEAIYGEVSAPIEI